MYPKQITILDHALDMLQTQHIPYPVDTETAAKVVGVSKTTLSQAKRSGRLPYQHPFEGGVTVVEYDRKSKNKDYWKISFKKST